MIFTTPELKIAISPETLALIDRNLPNASDFTKRLVAERIEMMKRQNQGGLFPDNRSNPPIAS